MLDSFQEQQLTGAGDTLLHFHLADRIPTHETLELLQAQDDFLTKTGDYTAAAKDDFILVDTTAGAVTITLPLAKAGKEYEVVLYAGANPATVVPSGSETILGGAGVVLSVLYTAIRFKAIEGTGYIAI